MEKEDLKKLGCCVLVSSLASGIFIFLLITSLRMLANAL